MTAYDNFAESFSKTRHAIWKCVGEFVEELPKHSFLLDVGCGNGKYSILRRKDVFWNGCDVSFNLLKIAQEKNPYVCLASGLRLPYVDKSFDYCISIAVLHHLRSNEERIRFIKELMRVTKKSILLTVWAAEQPIKAKWQKIGDTDYMIPWQNKYLRYYHLFTKEELIELMRLAEVEEYTILFEKDNWCIKF